PALRLEFLEGRTLLSVARATTDADPARTLFVRFSDGVVPRRQQLILRVDHAQALQSYPDGTSLVEPDPGVDREAVLRDLRRRPGVVCAAPNGMIRVASSGGPRLVPDDPQFGLQWGLDNPNDVDIDAPEAWALSTGRSSTIVAVIDSGLD